MRKTMIIVSVLVIVLFVACNKTTSKEDVNPLPKEYARIGNLGAKESDTPIEITITFTVGHDASDCDNSCCRIWDQQTHIPCQGSGNACPVTIKIGGKKSTQKSPAFDAEVDSLWEPTTEDYYPVPARSLVVLDAPEGSPYYLNIPEQTLVRDSLTDRFTFTGLFFSETAAYSNN